jgi:predicted regulator of Ras-like GTPase activity (Roadblock/LC7/MglB family)
MSKKQDDYDQYNLRSGLTLYPAQKEAIEQLLTELVHQAPATFLMLADVTGQVVSTRGEQSGVNLVALGSLVAGDLAASHEIARLTRQYQDYQMVLREGQTTHTFICEAGHHLALLIQVSTDTPLGWARVVIHKIAHRLAEIAATMPKEPRQTKEISTELSSEALPDLFNDALDDLWLE